jgi:soluble lytic murein transglycosylase
VSFSHGAPLARLLSALLLASSLAAACGWAEIARAQPALDATVRQVRQGDCAGAVPALERLAGETGLEAQRAAYLLGWCLARGGRHAAAAAAYRVASAHPTMGLYARAALADALVATGNPQEAVTVARDVSAAAGTSLRSRVLIALGEAEVARRRTGDGLSALEAAARLRPDDPAVWMTLGQTAAAAGRRDIARRAYARAAWAFPGDPTEAAARRALVQLLGRQPGRTDVDPESHLRRGTRLTAQGAWDQALPEYRAATAAPPGPVAGEAWYRLGELYLYSDTGAAYHAFRRAATMGWNTAGAWFWAAAAARRAGMARQAQEAATTLQRVAPTGFWTGRLWLGVGLRAEGAGRTADAALHYRRTIETAPATSDDVHEARWRLGWLALRGGRRTDAAARFKTAAETAPWRSAAARAWYWVAKTQESSGADADRAEAARILRMVADRYPLTYYGQRARARLGLGPTTLPPAVPHAPSQDRAGPTHEELARLGFDGDAAQAAEELRTANQDPRLARFLAEVYARLGDVPRSVAMADEALAHGIRDESTWRLAYPRAYWSDVTAAAQRAGIDPLFLISLVREESRYDHDVISPARAVGLAQLLPSTAQGLSSDPGITVRRLQDPATNLALGARYLRLQLDRFDGNLALALAAYNAGPGTARGWAALDPDLDYFVERVPFSETRAYIRRVLGTYGVYKRLW